MNINELLNEINNKGTAVFDGINETGTGVFDVMNEAGTAAIENTKGAFTQLRNAVKKQGGPSKSLSSNSRRKAGSSIPQKVGQYIDEISDQGAIPVAISGVHPMLRTATGYAKSLAGPLGKPFRIHTPQGTKDFYQDTIDAGDYTPGTDSSNGTIIFNENIKNKPEYDRLGGSFMNKDYGRYRAEVLRNGDVVPDDDYDTNRSVGWHARVALTGKDENGRSKNITDRVISAASAPHRALTDVGWTNLRPFGNNYSIGTKNL
jgi:hypothetical protein